MPFVCILQMQLLAIVYCELLCVTQVQVLRLSLDGLNYLTVHDRMRLAAFRPMRRLVQIIVACVPAFIYSNCTGNGQIQFALFFSLSLISQQTVVSCRLLLMCVTVLINCQQKVWFVCAPCSVMQRNNNYNEMSVLCYLSRCQQCMQLSTTTIIVYST